MTAVISDVGFTRNRRALVTGTMTVSLIRCYLCCCCCGLQGKRAFWRVRGIVAVQLRPAKPRLYNLAAGGPRAGTNCTFWRPSKAAEWAETYNLPLVVPGSAGGSGQAGKAFGEQGEEAVGVQRLQHHRIGLPRRAAGDVGAASARRPEVDADPCGAGAEQAGPDQPGDRAGVVQGNAAEPGARPARSPGSRRPPPAPRRCRRRAGRRGAAR